MVDPVTLDDVRAVLKDQDPRKTNAAVIRQRLGRGSFRTIQKHLVTLRAELAASERQQQSDETEQSSLSVPEELTAALRTVWVTALALAQQQLARRLVETEAQAEALAVEVNTLRADLEAMQEALETAEEQRQHAEIERQAAEEARRIAEEARAEAEQERAEAEQEKSKAQKMIEDIKEEAQAQIEQLKKEHTAALALVEARAERDQAVLRTELDRLVQQIVDLKTVLAMRLSAPEPAVVPQSTSNMQVERHHE